MTLWIVVPLLMSAVLVGCFLGLAVAARPDSRIWLVWLLGPLNAGIAYFWPDGGQWGVDGMLGAVWRRRAGDGAEGGADLGAGDGSGSIDRRTRP